MGVPMKKAAKTFKTMYNEVSKNTSKAINKTAPHVRAFAAKEVAKHYTIKQSDAKKMMTIKNKASAGKLETVVHAESRLLTPVHFKYTPSSGITSVKKYNSDGKKSRRPKTTVTIKKGNKKLLKHAFVAVVKGTRNVFYRTGKSRSSMVSLRSVSLPQMIANEKVSDALAKDMDEFFTKEFSRDYYKVAVKEGFK